MEKEDASSEVPNHPQARLAWHGQCGFQGDQFEKPPIKNPLYFLPVMAAEITSLLA
jgi:hypothetical protein